MQILVWTLDTGFCPPGIHESDTLELAYPKTFCVDARFATWSLAQGLAWPEVTSGLDIDSNKF